MLSPRELELLTAQVDGELSHRQSRQLARLLRRSAEAREMLERLMKDSRELSLAPVVPAPVDFSVTVLSTIATRNLKPRKLRPASHVPAAALSLWLGYATAAAVLLVVGVGSYLMNAPAPDRGPAPDRAGLVQKKPDDVPQLPAPREEGPAFVKKEPDGSGTPGMFEMPSVVRVVPDEMDEPEEQPVPVVPKDLKGEKGDRPTPPILASGHRESTRHLERVEFALPRIHILHGLGLVPEQAKALREQFALGNAYRVELPALDAVRGFERARAALTANKAALTLSADAQARLKKPGGRLDVALYLENIAPDDLAAALSQTGTADRLAAKKRAADRCFEGPLIVRELLGREDRRELKALLGEDPLESRPAAAGPIKVDIRKPLTDATGSAVADALDGKGVPRPGVAGGPSVGMVFALPAARGRTPEVQKFLSSRPVARPGTLRVLLVLRNVGP